MGTVRQSILDLIAQHVGSGDSDGAIHRTERLRGLAPPLLDLLPGNLLEIGAGVGATTVQFLRAALPRERKVVVVDPWNGEYRQEDFWASIRAFENEVDEEAMDTSRNLITVPFKSQSVEAREAILLYRPYALVFVDGCQEEEFCPPRGFSVHNTQPL